MLIRQESCPRLVHVRYHDLKCIAGCPWKPTSKGSSADSSSPSVYRGDRMGYAPSLMTVSRLGPPSVCCRSKCARLLGNYKVSFQSPNSSEIQTSMLRAPLSEPGVLILALDTHPECMDRFFASSCVLGGEEKRVRGGFMGKIGVGVWRTRIRR